jgi:DNA processing protein
VAGELPVTAEMVAMVGSRRCSVYGEDLAYAMAGELAAAGLVIVSGLALGIDGAAHRGALDAGGLTVAVMGTGPDTIYPYQHRDLAARIAGQGALVTQFPDGTAPLPGNFPTRNAVISGMSLAVVVVEAALKSGAMLTAGSAAEQDRLVMAVPGSVYSPGSRGCHELIRDSASLVTCADDILDELKKDTGRTGRLPTLEWVAFGDTRDRVLETLAAGGLTLDQLQRALEVDPSEVAVAVSNLRIDGLVAMRRGLVEARRRT